MDNKNLLELIKDHSYVVYGKVKQNVITFIHISNEQVEFAIKNVIPFLLTPQIKFLLM